MADIVSVIGGGGYIGQELVRGLVVRGYEVFVIDPKPVRFGVEIDKHIYQLSMTFEEWTKDNRPNERRMFSDSSVIFHLAGVVGVQACEAIGYKEAVRRNTILTNLICDWTHLDQTIVFASTTAIYGEQSIYTITKAQSEYIVQKRKNSIVLRLATIFGPSHGDRDGILVNDLVKTALKEGSLKIWDPWCKRPVLFIDDCVDWMIDIIADPENKKLASRMGAIDFGSQDMQYQKSSIGQAIKNKLPYLDFEFDHMITSRYRQDFILSFDNVERLGLSPKTTLYDGIKRLIEDARR